MANLYSYPVTGPGGYETLSVRPAVVISDFGGSPSCLDNSDFVLTPQEFFMETGRPSRGIWGLGALSY